MKIGFEQSGCHPDGDYSGEWGGRIPLSLTTVLAAQKYLKNGCSPSGSHRTGYPVREMTELQRAL
jgi:hypothetical protein